MSMSNETWFMRYAPIAVPCPKCGGRVWFGSDYDWPPELGGDHIQDRCECEACKAEWTTETAPEDFSVPNGKYWNLVIPSTDESIWRDLDEKKPQYSEFALLGCSTCGATGQPMFGSVCANCFASGHEEL